MKKILLFLTVALTFMFTSCKKQDVATTGKMKLPQVSLVQGSQLITKTAGNTITQLTYEFWVKAPNGTSSTSGWVLGSNALYKDGSTAQANNSAIWTLSYPTMNPISPSTMPNQGFIEVPLNMETRIVIKGADDSGIKYYGIYDTGAGGWTNANIGTVTVNLYEIDSRLNINVDDLILNRNFDFHFVFSGHVQPVNYNSIVQLSNFWLLNASANNRDFQAVPYLSTSSTLFTTIVDIIGAGSTTGTPTYKINGSPVPSINSIFELFAQGSTDFTTVYSIVRKDGYVVVAPKTITMASPTTNGFNPSNWCQAGYNFNITFTADPQQLGQGVFVGTLTVNDNINGTVPL